MGSSTLWDLSKMCRICLKCDSQGLVSMFNTAFTVRPVDMIRMLNLFKVDSAEGLPSCLCQSCICRLLDAYNLKQQCELSDIKFREYLDTTTPVSFASKDIESLKSFNNSAPPEKSLSGSHIRKDEEIYDTMDVVCDIFDKNNSENIEVTDNVLKDVIDVNNLTKPDDGTADEEPCSNSNITEDCRTLQKKKDKSSKVKIKKRKRKDKAQLKAPEKCSECEKIFPYSGYLEIHMRTHTGKKPFECDVCGRRFTQVGNLSLHKRIHTGERRYQCEICSKLFTTSSNLTAHRKSHSEMRNFKCAHCLRAFKTQRELKSHEGTHTGEKNYTCEICQKAFYKQSYLNVHIKAIHKGEKKFQCDECKKYFSSSSNLICHYRIHTGEKPFQCQNCNARFNQSSALARHARTHTKHNLAPIEIVSTKEIEKRIEGKTNEYVKMPKVETVLSEKKNYLECQETLKKDVIGQCEEIPKDIVKI